MAENNTAILLTDALATLATTTEFSRITVTTITDAAGVHRKTFYYHFVDKFDALKYWYRRFLTEDDCPYTAATWDHDLEKLFARMKDHSQLFSNTALQDNGLWDQMFQQFLFEKLLTKFALTPIAMSLTDTDIQMTALFLSSGITQLVLSWNQQHFVKSPHDVVLGIVRLIEASHQIINSSDFKRSLDVS